MTGLATTADLLTGDLALDGVTSQDWIDRAWTEIQGVLSERYVISDTGTELGTGDQALLKTVQSHIATARLIMAQSATGMDNDLDQYAEYLLNEAMSILTAIVSGARNLTGANVVATVANNNLLPEVVSATSTAGVIQPDARSPLDVFDDFTTGRTVTNPWGPGDDTQFSTS